MADFDVPGLSLTSISIIRGSSWFYVNIRIRCFSCARKLCMFLDYLEFIMYIYLCLPKRFHRLLKWSRFYLCGCVLLRLPWFFQSETLCFPLADN